MHKYRKRVTKQKYLFRELVDQPNTAQVCEISAQVCTSTTTLVHKWPVAEPPYHLCNNVIVLVHTRAVILLMSVVLG